MKTARRILGMLLCIVLCVSFFPAASAYAEEAVEEEEIIFDAEQSEEVEDTQEDAVETPVGDEVFVDSESEQEEEPAVEAGEEETSSHTHVYTSAVTAPTCTEQGYTTYSCECGDSYVDDYVDATGHTAEDVAEVPATTESTGTTAGKKCSVCGTVLEGCEEIPVLSTENETAEEVAEAVNVEENVEEPAEAVSEETNTEEEAAAVSESEESVEETTETDEAEKADAEEQNISAEGETEDTIEAKSDTTETELIEAVGELIYIPEDTSTDEDLLDTYAARELGLISTSVGNVLMSPANPTRNFSTDQIYAYGILSDDITRTAAGELTSTSYSVTFSPALNWTAEELNLERFTSDNIADAAAEALEEDLPLDQLHNALVNVYVYELYWYDKTMGVSMSYGISSNGTTLSIETVTYIFRVSADYAPGNVTGGTEVDASYGTRVRNAVSNAESIVAEFSGEALYNKLWDYCNRICALNSYNYTAAGGGVDYGDPWQIISVFDGDESTNVVCEGYSKAFQYLCDITDGLGANVYTATGLMGREGDDGGDHMWNIITMDDGLNYLADITNCDNGSGAGNDLFLKGYTEETENGYIFARSYDRVFYTYDTDTLSAYSSAELAISGSDYGEESTSSDPELGVPTWKSGSSTTSGIKLIWNAVEGATGYRLTRDGTVLASVDATETDTVTYVDTSAEYGMKYTYTVQVVVGENIGEASIAKEITRVAAPTISGIANTAAGVLIKWGAVDGATEYRIYRDGTLAGKVAGTSYTDTAAESGTKYVYKVRSYDGSNAGLSSGTKTLVFLAATEITAVNNATTGVTVSWAAVTGATKYRVYRDGKSLAYVTDGTSYTDTAAESGTTYTYTVRVYADSYYSVLSEESSITCVARPTISSIANAKAGVTVKWDAVDGATKYRIFRKGPGETSYTKLADTTKLTYTDTTVASSNKYYYKVRAALTAEGTTTWGVSSGVKSITYIAVPGITSLVAANGKVTVKWGAVVGAVNYRVFRKVGTGSWKKLADTTSVSYVDTTVEAGTTYSYTVRCLNAAGTSFTSGTDLTGKTLTYTAKPVLSKVTGANGQVTFTWTATAGAENYRVFRKTDGGSWTKLADTTALKYVDKTVEAGTQYSYTVRCITTDGKTYTGWFNTTGLAITYTAAPTLSGAKATYGQVKVSWAAVTGAEKYRVLRKTGSGSWTKLADTTALTYTDKTVQEGTEYSYTVRCISSAGTYTGGYDTTGKTVTAVKSTDASYFSYTVLDDGTASITGCTATGDIIIPGTLGGKTVTNLAAQLFYGKSGITSVRIPSSVTYFGTDPDDNDWDYVFSYCFDLKTITVDSGNPTFKSVSGVLFSKDGSKLINYPCNHSGTTYRVTAEMLCCTSFASCQNLTSLYLDNADTYWMTYTFYNDGNLKVYYKTGGYSETRAQQFINSGLSYDSDTTYCKFVAA